MNTPETRPTAGDWTIRETGPVDAEALALVGAATFLETFSGVLDGAAILNHCRRIHNADACRAMFASGARAWLAEVAPGAAPIGFALLTSSDLPGAQEGDLELKRLYVLSRFHGGGPGRALMETTITAARAARASRLLLGVYARNDRALAFYERSGFAHVADRRYDIGGVQYDDKVMALPL